MPTIVGLPGSLRAGSLNTKLLHAVARLAPAGTTVEIESIRGIPLYDGDIEDASGIPETVARLKDRVAEADGLLLVKPPRPLKHRSQPVLSFRPGANFPARRLYRPKMSLASC